MEISHEWVNTLGLVAVSLFWGFVFGHCIGEGHGRDAEVAHQNKLKHEETVKAIWEEERRKNAELQPPHVSPS